MARVTVAINVRDLTGGDLARIRGRFSNLTDSLNRFAGNRSQQNLAQMRQQFADMNTEIQSLAGRIPHQEFVRLQRNAQSFAYHMRAAAGPTTARQFGLMRSRLLDIDRDLNRIGARPPTVVDITARDRTGPGLRRTESRIRRWALGPLRGLVGMIGGILSDGIGQGIVGAFRSPAFGVLLVGAITAALSLVGAALAGILVLAIGGAFVGLGGMIAAKSKEVTRNWAQEMESLKKVFKEAAEPMIPVLHRATHIMGDMGREFAPHFKEALEKVAPHLDSFIDATRSGFRKMGQHAWDDLQEAFRVFLDAFGPEWEDFLAEFGKSLGALARTVSDHSTEIAGALRSVLGVINFLIDAINFFANAWVQAVHFANDATASFLDGIALLLDGFMGMVDGMLGGLESVAKLLGFGDEVAAAREAFNELRDSAVSRFADMADKARYLNTDLDNTNRKRKLEVDIESWTNELTRAKKELASVPPERRAEVKANIADLENKIASATRQLNGMQKDYYVRIHGYKVGDWALTGGGGPGMAHGGIAGHVGRAATGGARSNMTLVGEQGPELVNLAPGSHVRSNADSRRLLGQPGASAGAPTLVIQSSGRRIDDLLIEVLREVIHQRGGDPVTVLGGR